MDARCQCGAVRFTTPLAAPLRLYVCHCTECRHQSSSSYGLTAAFPAFPLAGAPTPAPPATPAPEASRPAIDGGGIAIYARPNPSGRTDGYFCVRCGSRLMHRPVARDGQEPATVSVKAGCLTGLSREMMAHAVHIWTDEAVVPVPEGAESWPGEPEGGSFAEAKQGGR